jgi:hypothetical protein
MDEQKPPTPPDPVHQPGTGKGEEKVKTEGKAPGRQDTGSTGKAKRPSGKSTAKDSTGINPKDPQDPESPHIPAP